MFPAAVEGAKTFDSSRLLFPEKSKAQESTWPMFLA